MAESKDWRLSLLQICGPGVLSGIRLGDWLRLLREHGRDVDLSRLLRVFAISLQSVKNSALGLVERHRFAEALPKVVIQPPLFILGHWRSGTTHLHQLLCQDDRFAFPNSYQTAFPHIFLSSERLEARMLAPFMPARRPMDNVDQTLASPQEDEFALCGSSLKSSCMQWVFPRKKEIFRKYLSLKAADPKELAEWKEALLTFLRKLQWRYGRPLLLKSPQHTARIRLLLELFPDARFVHIHRNPFRVFQSSRKLFQIMFAWHGLQRPGPEEVDDWVIEQYREMYDAFFEEQSLIPAGRFHEVAYEELDRDPIGQTERLYSALQLPDFKTVEPKLRRYVDSLSGYRKNEFSDLSPDLKNRISQSWGFCFEKWGYECDKPLHIPKALSGN